MNFNITAGTIARTAVLLLALTNQMLSAMGKSPLPIVFISGHGDLEMAVKAIKDGAVDFVQKPYREQQLLDAINEALQRDAQQHRGSLRGIFAAKAIAFQNIGHCRLSSSNFLTNR